MYSFPMRSADPWQVVICAVQRGDVPGAVAVVSVAGRVVLRRAAGWSALEPERRPMRDDTVFDLASLTKPLSTATLLLTLVDSGDVSLDDPVGTYVPGFRGLGEKGVTPRRLLAHTSGLPGWRPTHSCGGDRQQVLRLIDSMELAYRPGTRVDYSCIGYIALGLLIEEVAGTRLDALFQERIARPLGLGAGYLPQLLPGDRFAVTERGNAFEEAMLRRAGGEFDGWRRDFYPGQVNDGNAFYGLGGVSGNAGLFSSADDVVRLGRMWLERGSIDGRMILSPAAVALATSDQTPGLNIRRGLGWLLSTPGAPDAAELAIPPSSRAYFPPEWSDVPWGPRPGGELLSPSAFGHTGFTGTSIWVDPARELVAVLLTNATHPSVGTGIASLRARFHNSLIAALGG